MDELAPVRAVGVSDQPEVGVEGLRGLVVERVEEVDAVLISLVRKVGEQTLMNKVLHLLASNLEKFI